MTLQQQIEKMQEMLLPQIPKHLLDPLVSTTRELVESGIAKNGLQHNCLPHPVRASSHAFKRMTVTCISPEFALIAVKSGDVDRHFVALGALQLESG